jgi:hypothetical protein
MASEEECKNMNQIRKKEKEKDKPGCGKKMRV